MFNSTNADNKLGSPARVTWRKVADHLNHKVEAPNAEWWWLHLSAFLLGAALTLAVQLACEVWR